MSDTAYYCHDPLKPFETIHTEAAGEIKPTGGHFTTSNATLAQELKAQRPWMIVTPHDKQATTGRAHAIMWTVPEMPWKKQRRETEQGAVSPQEVTSDAEHPAV